LRLSSSQRREDKKKGRERRDTDYGHGAYILTDKEVNEIATHNSLSMTVSTMFSLASLQVSYYNGIGKEREGP